MRFLAICFFFHVGLVLGFLEAKRQRLVEALHQRLIDSGAATYEIQTSNVLKAQAAFHQRKGILHRPFLDETVEYYLQPRIFLLSRGIAESAECSCVLPILRGKAEVGTTTYALPLTITASTSCEAVLPQQSTVALLQIIPARMKIPISTRKKTPVTATVRNTSSTVRKNMARLGLWTSPKNKIYS